MGTLLLVACAGAPTAPPNLRLAHAADYNRRGEAALEQGDYRKALVSYEAALRTDLSVENWEGIAINSLNLARVHQLLGENALAQQRLDALLESGGPVSAEHTAAARLRKALLYQAQGDLSGAASWVELAADICRDGCVWLGTLLNLRARLALAHGDSAAAKALAGQALAVNRGRQAREETANSLRLQGQACIGQTEFEVALGPLHEALALDSGLGLPERIEQDLRHLADAHAGLGNADVAAAFRLRAARVARRELKIE